MKRIPIALLILSLLGACQDIFESTPDHQVGGMPEGVSINTDLDALSARVSEKNETITVEGLSPNASRILSQYELTLKAEIASPEVGGETIMATSLDLHDGNFAVGYNYAGEEVRGGVDLIQLNNGELILESQVSLNSAEVSHLYYDQYSMVYAGAVSDSDSTAFADEMDVVSGLPETDSYHRLSLGGHASTSVTADEDNLYIVSGASTDNGGGLHVIDRSSKSLVQHIAIHDARWVDIVSQKIVVLGADPGVLTIINKEDYSVVSEISVSGLDAIGFKSAFSIDENILYVAAGYEGIHVYNLIDGSHMANIPLPEGTSDLYALSVSAEDAIGYVAAGESVYMFSIDDSTQPYTFEIVGRLELGNFQSINEVIYVDGFLAIAAGLGGTKLISVNDPSREDDEELLVNGNFDDGSIAWDLSGTVNADDNWIGETSMQFSGGNESVTGVIQQEFSATSGATTRIRANYFRRGASGQEVSAELEVFDFYTGERLFADTLITPTEREQLVTLNESFISSSDRLVVRVTDITENTVNRDFYLTDISITQPVEPTSRIIKISSFEEDDITDQWHQNGDEDELAINTVVEDTDGNQVWQIQGQNANDNTNLGGSWTRLARSATGLEGYSADQVYINFDLKADNTDGYVKLVFQARDVDGTLRNWVSSVNLDWDGWRRVNMKLSSFVSNGGAFNGDVTDLRVWSITVRNRTDLPHDIMIDNLYYSTRSPWVDLNIQSNF